MNYRVPFLRVLTEELNEEFPKAIKSIRCLDSWDEGTRIEVIRRSDAAREFPVLTLADPARELTRLHLLIAAWVRPKPGRPGAARPPQYRGPQRHKPL